MSDDNDGIWFIYDGECLICQYAAQALRIKREFGELHLLDARTQADHPLVQTVNQRGLDLDEGMVIVQNNRFYHGKTALRFMAQYGAQGIFNWFNRLLFWSSWISALLYPWMRGTRNWLLRVRGKSKIDNLQLKNQPIFQSVFGDAWTTLPPVMQKRYANRPYSRDKVVVVGLLDVEHRSVLRLLAPLYRLLGTVPMETASQVPVTVNFESDENSKSFHFNRVFHFPGKPYAFRSRMLQVNGADLVEIMRFGVCWCLRYAWEDGKVKLHHRGYALHWFGHFIPVPLHWLLGRGEAEEIALDDHNFAMNVVMIHPLFGQLYRYHGQFRVTSVS